MRKVKFFPGEYYHVYNRGFEKSTIFRDKRDYIRFLFLIFFFQAPILIFNLGHYISYYVKHRVFNIKEEKIKKIVEKRVVELVEFTLMPNHFHLILREKIHGGISSYMQRVLDAYTKYFNAKYERSGHLFQGPFQAIHVETNEQLLYLSAYIHRNPRELRGWSDKEDKYPWSSYQDYVKENRWGKLLVIHHILEQFPNNHEYHVHVQESGAKEMA